MESGNGAVVHAYLQQCLTQLRDEEVDVALPADEYKAVDIGKKQAVSRLKQMLAPFLQYQSIEVQKRIKKDSLYYTHEPRVKI